MKFQYGVISSYRGLTRTGQIQASEGDEVSFSLSDFHPSEQRLVRAEQPVAYLTNDNRLAHLVKIVSPSIIQSIQTGERILGNSKYWKDGSSYGFIVPADGSGSVFVHLNSIKSRKPLSKWQEVSFRVVETDGSLNAIDVVLITNEQESSEEVSATA